MIAIRLLVDALIYSGVLIGYLLLVMVVLNPRVWGYHDYPDVVREMVPPQTSREKLLAVLVGLPWVAIALAFPIRSALSLKASLGGEIPFLLAFVCPLVLLQVANLLEVVLLDWLVVSRITPSFVIISGTAREHYRDMSHHYRSHVRASLAMVVLSAVIGAVVAWA